MEKEILQNELPILEEMLALMTEQQELILDITAELQTANQDLAQAEKVIREKDRQINSLQSLVHQLNDENEQLMRLYARNSSIASLFTKSSRSS